VSFNLGTARIVLKRSPRENVTIDYAMRLTRDGLVTQLLPGGATLVGVTRGALIDHLAEAYPTATREELEAAFDELVGQEGA
jgi:hypothetical protein